MERYGIITEKNPREIVLLRGKGCQWRRCTFCDYHLDSSLDAAANFALNREVLAHVTGEYGRLEVINSGSFVDLDPKTVWEIREIAVQKNIGVLHFECHWMHRKELEPFRLFFAEVGVRVIYKIGVETFDIPLREKVLQKGIGVALPAEIVAAGFEEVNLLCGLHGQTAKSMIEDIRIGLAFFSRVCVNLMTKNTTKVAPDPEAVAAFMCEVLPRYRHDPRVDILLENTDFGVG